MSSIRFYAILTAIALAASLILVVGPGPQAATAHPSQGTLAGAAVTVTEAPQATTTIVEGLARSARPTPPMDEPRLPRGTSTTLGTDESESKTPPPTTTQPPTTTAPTRVTTTIQSGFRSDYASQFASRINELRGSKGKPALSRSGSLDAEAESWAKKMAQAGALSHSTVGRLIPPWSAAAENVGSGGSVSSLFSALAGSSGHRSNMLGDYTHFGVGVWVDSHGVIWTTHLFAR